MDEMRIVSKFTRGIISKALKVMVRKKSGYNVDIQVNEITTTINDGKTHLHVDVDAELERDELIKILKHHKLDEWREFCKWIESLPYSELIVGGEEIKYYADNREVKDEQN